MSNMEYLRVIDIANCELLLAISITLRYSMLLMITPPTRSRCTQYTVYFPPGRHSRPDDGPVSGPKHVVYISNK